MAKPVLLCLAAVAAAVTPPAPLDAQCRLCATPVTHRSDSAGADRIELEVETSLNFGRLVMFGEGQGSAIIKADGSQAATGTISGPGTRAMVGSAVIRGEPGRAVRVDLPSRILLYSLSGGTIEFDQVTSDLPAMPRLDASGRLAFRLGGRVQISGDAEGNYRGDLPINVEYP